MGLFWNLAVCKQKTILILNWFFLNRTVYEKNGFDIKEPLKITLDEVPDLSANKRTTLANGILNVFI